MAHFTRVRADLAAWGIGTGVSQDEFEKFDANLFASINGDAGGTWAPSARIVIGGQGLEVAGAVLLLSGDGALTVQTDASFSGGFSHFTGVFQFNNGFTVADGSVSFNGQSVTEVLGSWQFTYGFTGLGDTVIGAETGTHTLVVRATETHYGAETHSGAEAHTGNETHSGTESHSGQETHSGTEIHNGNETHNASCTFLGRFSAVYDCSPVYFAPDGNVTITGLEYKEFVFLPSANRRFDINFGGDPPVAGTRLYLWSRTSVYSTSVYVDGTLFGAVGGGSSNFAVMMYNGSTWLWLSP